MSVLGAMRLAGSIPLADPAVDRDQRLSRRALIALGLGAGAALAGCGASTVQLTRPPRALPGLKIGLSLPDRGTVSLCTASGVARALAGTGAVLVARDAGGSALREVINIESLAADERVAGLVAVPLSFTATRKASRVAHHEGVEVASTFMPDPGTAVRVFAGWGDARDMQGGVMLGQWLARALPGGGEVAVVQGPTDQGPTQRLDSGLDVALAAAPRLALVARGAGDGDPLQAVQLVETMLAEHPRTRAIVSYDPAMGAAIAGKLQALRRSDIVHVSSGADLDTARWLRTPYLRAVRWFSPAELGFQAGIVVRESITQGKRLLDPPGRPVAQAMRTGGELAGAPIPCFTEQLGAVRAALAAA